jgi:hypothetical protein
MLEGQQKRQYFWSEVRGPGKKLQSGDEEGPRAEETVRKGSREDR